MKCRCLLARHWAPCTVGLCGHCFLAPGIVSTPRCPDLWSLKCFHAAYPVCKGEQSPHFRKRGSDFETSSPRAGASPRSCGYPHLGSNRTSETKLFLETGCLLGLWQFSWPGWGMAPLPPAQGGVCPQLPQVSSLQKVPSRPAPAWRVAPPHCSQAGVARDGSKGSWKPGKHFQTRPVSIDVTAAPPPGRSSRTPLCGWRGVRCPLGPCVDFVVLEENSWAWPWEHSVCACRRGSQGVQGGQNS